MNATGVGGWGRSGGLGGGGWRGDWGFGLVDVVVDLHLVVRVVVGAPRLVLVGVEPVLWSN